MTTDLEDLLRGRLRAAADLPDPAHLSIDPMQVVESGRAVRRRRRSRTCVAASSAA